MKKLFSLLLLGACAFPSLAQWNTNTAQNLQIAPLQVADMKAASTKDGKTWIAYYSKRAGTNQFDMYAQLLDTAGNKILGPNGVLVDSFNSSSSISVFNIGLDGKGDDLIIGMQDKRGGTYITPVAYRIDQSGTSIWNNMTGVVLGSLTVSGYSPYVTALKSGDIVFAWLDNGGKIYYQKVANNGTLAWATPKIMAPNSRRAQMVPMSDSGFMMVYQQPLGVVNSKPYAMRFNQNGDSVWTSSVLLNTNNETTSSARYYSIMNDKDTTYFGYYSSTPQNHFNGWVQRINPDGTLPYTPATALNGGAAVSDYSTNADPQEQGVEIAMQPGSSVIWSVSSMTNSTSDQYGVFVQQFTKSTGTRLLNQYGKVVYPMNGGDRYTQQGSLTMKGKYPVFMVGSGVNYKIRGTVLDTAGNFLLSYQDVELSSTTTTLAKPKGRTNFTQMVNSLSVALWTEFRPDTPLYGFGYAQPFLLDMLDTSVTVKTLNNVPAVINTYHGTLDMTASVHPTTATQDVTWSIVTGTGSATISTTGIVTAVTNGTVWAKATSVQAPSFADSMMVTISNQALIVTVNTVGNVPATITTYHGTLPMIATITPTTVLQDVTWSLVPGTGNATISNTGIVTASINGTVWAKATSVLDPAYSDSMKITISNNQGTDGISEIEKNIGFSAYPNPANNVLNLYIKAQHPALDITIVDLNGKVILSDKVTANALNNAKTINLKQFASGTYILQVKGEGLNINKKFSKQ